MQEITLTSTQYVLLGSAFGAVLGFLFGLIPLIVGIKKGQKKLGLWGLAASTITGMLSGILSLIVIAVFLVVILKNAAKPAKDTPEPPSEADA